MRLIRPAAAPAVAARVLRALGVLSLTMAVAAGCASDPATGSPSDGRFSLEPTLEFTAAMSRAEIPVGERASLTLTLRNTGDAPLSFDFPSGCQIVYYIERTSGERVAPEDGNWFCTAALTSLVLAPGETRGREIPIRGGVPAQPTYLELALEPGHYRVHGALGVEPQEFARTNVVEFTVRE